MKEIVKYINESLSEENRRTLEEMIKNNMVDDDDIKYILKHHKKLNLLTDDKIKQYNDVLDKKGLNDLDWPRKKSALDCFISIFDDNIEKFDEIMNNNGVIASIDNMKETDNIFSHCNGFVEEAKNISSLTYSKGNIVSGKFEILLKLILNDTSQRGEGDVPIKGSTGGLEIKCNSIKLNKTKGTKSKSGGRPFSQGSHYMKVWRIYQYLNKYLFEIGDDNKTADESHYFQGNKGENNHIDKFIESVKDMDIRIVIKNIVYAIYYQYDFIDKDQKYIDGNDNALNKLFDSAINFINGELTPDKITSLIGCLQLCCYSLREKFDYFMLVHFDSTEDDDTDNIKNSGKYLLLKNCQDLNSKDNKLYDFDYLTTYITFSNIGTPKDDRSKAGQMYLNVNKI